MKLPVSVIIPIKNEILNLKSNLEKVVRNFDEVIIADSFSSDGSKEYALRLGCIVINFEYNGGWPKKRQWVLNTHKFRNNWIFLLDADEYLTNDFINELRDAIFHDNCDGFWIKFSTSFLGKDLRFGNTKFYKLVLFKNGYARYESRLKNQDSSMADMEIHEHIILNGKQGVLKNSIWDRNKNSLFRFIAKHNEYSNWEAKVYLDGLDLDMRPNLLGNLAQRRRWIKKTFLFFPFSPFIYFLYSYLFKLGFLDGKPGFLYSVYQGIQMFIVKSKIYELKNNP